MMALQSGDSRQAAATGGMPISKPPPRASARERVCGVLRGADKQRILMTRAGDTGALNILKQQF